MSVGGTARYRTATHVPPLVVRAAVLGYELGFENSCIPEQGRLLRVLAAGRAGGRIGETGTGCGVGLAWLVSGADATTPIVSVERDAELATRTAELFAEHPNVTVRARRLDARSSRTHRSTCSCSTAAARASTTTPIDPAVALAPGGTLVIDDFTPSVEWPPTYDGGPDAARLHWFEHPLLSAAEIRTTAGERDDRRVGAAADQG